MEILGNDEINNCIETFLHGRSERLFSPVNLRFISVVVFPSFVILFKYLLFYNFVIRYPSQRLSLIIGNAGIYIGPRIFRGLAIIFYSEILLKITTWNLPFLIIRVDIFLISVLIIDIGLILY